LKLLEARAAALLRASEPEAPAEQSEGQSKAAQKPSEAMARIVPFWLRRGAQA